MKMKKIRNIALGILLVGSVLSCSEDFLTQTPSESLPSEGAFKTTRDVSNGLNGAYYAFGDYKFYGRNVIALGDMASDNCYMTGSSGHMGDIYKYQIVEQLLDLEYIWENGYQVLDRSTRVIIGGKALLASARDKNKNSLNNSISQAYALRALSTFTLVNIFGKPYNTANEGTLGIVLLKDKPIASFEKISRATLKETYALILEDIAKAKEHQALTDAMPCQNYMNKAAIFALEARVKLYMGNYTEAITAAESAIATRKGNMIYDQNAYYAQFTSVTITSEDIFTIGKSEEDNLSANSLNTLYDTYGGLINQQLIDKFAVTDIRNSLFRAVAVGTRGLKYVGLAASAATSNVPVFRLPEMYLILAEAYAQNNNIPEAAKNLLFVAKRNTAIATTTDLPGTKSEILTFVANERQRELFQEGQRWFDLRRTGQKLDRASGLPLIKNYDVSKFCYPIPAYEINASGIVQNPDWSTNLPK